ncbi:MAG TPA: ABC transporter permease [Streptosporangiaceae bacterium]|jgi:peptide/nickel transport system permease protein|nr:ABC transporter permease [Streptosporangiaceae bacterium]
MSMILAGEPSGPPPGTEPPADGGAAAAGGSAWRMILSVFVQNRLAVLGVAIVGLMVLFSFAGPLIYHTDQVHANLSAINTPPSGAHPLGTDNVGYDVLGRLMVSGQSSLIVGVAAAALATVVGTLWGAVAGYVGGAVDAVMMRIVDSVLSIPPLIFILLLASVFRPSTGALIVVVAVVAWLAPARLVRGEAISLRAREFVQASTAMGGRRTWIVLRHITPNAVGTIVVQATFEVANAILLLAALSYLGLGPAPPATNWGSMLSDGLNYMYEGKWWLIYPPGLAIVLTVVAFNFIGDALRAALEVRLQAR